MWCRLQRPRADLHTVEVLGCTFAEQAVGVARVVKDCNWPVSTRDVGEEEHGWVFELGDQTLIMNVRSLSLDMISGADSLPSGISSSSLVPESSAQ